MSQNKYVGDYSVGCCVPFIKQFEGCELTAYRCSAGVLTIGYGHTGSDVQEGMAISQSDAEKLLIDDLTEFQDELAPLVSVPVTEGQFIALMSFVFNLGISAFKRSTLRRELNVGNVNRAADEFLKWVNAGGKPVIGLQRRRAAERELFLGD